jgi:hypothetical protein
MKNVILWTSSSAARTCVNMHGKVWASSGNISVRKFLPRIIVKRLK